MAENEVSETADTTAEQSGDQATATAVEEPQAFKYEVQIEDAGPATKKVTVAIPAERISEKLAEQFKELRQQAAIPGFRPGHAPQKLVEKRFAQDAREQVRRSLIGESYQQALEANSLEVIGEPVFENAEAIQLPANGPLNYSFQVEVQPNFEVPELKGLKIRKPRIEVKDENVDQAMSNLREQQGALVPIEDRGVEARDYLVADVHIKVDGLVVSHQHDAQIVARPGRVAGIQIDDLDAQLAGLKPGETRTLTVKVPDDHPSEVVRGKDVQIDVALKELKKLELAEIDQVFLDSLGFTNADELREALREQMIERIDYDVQQVMRDQVGQYLLEHVQFDLPSKLSDRQTSRIVSRRAVDLMMRGMPREQIENHLDALRGGAREEAGRELKLFFILEKIANTLKVEVDEAELNGRISMLAAQRGRRPEKMKQDMAKDESLQTLYVQMREQKAIDRILVDAVIEEYEAKPGGEEK